MDIDERDHALHDSMCIIWSAYRKGMKEFNGCFKMLYEKYSDPIVLKFIKNMGVSLAPAANKKVEG